MVKVIKLGHSEAFQNVKFQNFLQSWSQFLKSFLIFDQKILANGQDRTLRSPKLGFRNGNVIKIKDKSYY